MPLTVQISFLLMSPASSTRSARSAAQSWFTHDILPTVHVEGRLCQEAGCQNSTDSPRSSAFLRSSSTEELHNDDIVDFIFSKLEESLGLNLALKNTTAGLMRITRNGPEDLLALKWAVVVSTAATLFSVLSFAMLLRCIPGVYGHRAVVDFRGYDATLPTLDMGLVGWLRAARDTEAAQVVAVAGLDSLMLSEFHALCRRILSVIGPVVVIVLCPLHFSLGSAGGIDFLSRFGVGALLNTANLRTTVVHDGPLPKEWVTMLLCWIHAALVWLVVLIVVRFIFDAQDHFLRFRFKWLQDIPSVRAKTLMIEGIPREYCSDDALRAYFALLFSDQAVERAYIVRKTAELRRRVREAECIAQRLAHAKTRWQAVGCDPDRRPQLERLACLRKHQDAIDVLTVRLQVAEKELEHERARIEAAVPLCSPEVCSSSGFVTFTTRHWCRLASREQLRADASEFVMRMPPDPTDVVYEDLARDPAHQAGLDWTAGLLTFAVACTWMPVVVTISCMTNLNTLRSRIYVVDTLCAQFPQIQATLEGALATIALKSFMAMLPTVMMWIIEGFLTSKAQSWAQLELQKRYFAFQVVFVLLVTAINKTVLASLHRLIKAPNELFALLADNLPNSSHFYLNYLVLGWFTAAMDLLRVSVLLKYLTLRALGSDLEEARKLAEPDSSDASDGMGARMARAAFVMTITLVFSTCSPLITVFSWVYFFLGEHTYRYLLVYAEARKPDLGGAFWLSGLKSLMFALGLYVALSVGILCRVGNRPAATTAACSVIVILVGFLRFCNVTGEALPFEVIVETDNVAYRSSIFGAMPAIRVATYVQPECVASSRSIA